MKFKSARIKKMLLTVSLVSFLMPTAAIAQENPGNQITTETSSEVATGDSSVPSEAVVNEDSASPIPSIPEITLVAPDLSIGAGSDLPEVVVVDDFVLLEPPTPEITLVTPDGTIGSGSRDLTEDDVNDRVVSPELPAPEIYAIVPVVKTDDASESTGLDFKDDDSKPTLQIFGFAVNLPQLGSKKHSENANQSLSAARRDEIGNPATQVADQTKSSKNAGPTFIKKIFRKRKPIYKHGPAQ